MRLSKTHSRRFRSQPGGLFEGNGINSFSWWVESIQHCRHLASAQDWEEMFSVLSLTSECILCESGALLLSLMSSSGFVATVWRIWLSEAARLLRSRVSLSLRRSLGTIPHRTGRRSVGVGLMHPLISLKQLLSEASTFLQWALWLQIGEQYSAVE